MGKSKKRKSNQDVTEAPLGKLKKNETEEDLDTECDVEMRKNKKKKSKKVKRHKNVSAKLENATPIAKSEEMASCFNQQSPMEISPQKELGDQPQICIDLSGLFASNGPRPNGSHLHCNDIKNLLMFTILGSGRWEAPKWCDLNSWRNVKHTLFIMVGCVSGEDFVVYKECFENINSIFPRGFPVKNDGNDGVFVSPLQSYLFYNMKKKSAKKKVKDLKKLIPSELLLSKEQRFVNEFPVFEENDDGSFCDKNEGWISTCTNPKTAEEESIVPENSRMFAIDCEMCISCDGKELTRVSVVNENFEVVYDSYVKPKAQITDYLTQYSGITPEILKNVRTTLGDAQQKLLEIISPNDIIVGHSLDNDMRALQMYHENYIDTSVIYGDQRGTRFKPSLKFLVKQYLRREIQNNEMGHCSNEDAKACMELVQLKLEKGIQFGVFSKPNESIFEAFSRAEKKSVIIDTSCIARQHCFDFTKGVLCSSDEEVVSGTVKSTGTAEFVFAHLKDFERLVKAHDSSGENPNTSQVKETFRKIDENIKTMIENVPSSSLMVCLLASGFLSSRIQSLQREKGKRKSEEVASAIRRARDCLCFIKVKE